jgi:hypothetical protein
VNKSVLLSKGWRHADSRLAPTPATRRQFNPKGADKFGIPKNFLHQAEICIIHLVSALALALTMTLFPISRQDLNMSSNPVNQDLC